MRGRPKENIEIKRKYTQTFYDVPSKPELGGKSDVIIAEPEIKVIDI